MTGLLGDRDEGLKTANYKITVCYAREHGGSDL